MVAHMKPLYITPEQYLKQERDAEKKSEYWDGVVVAMAGAGPEHDRIAGDIYTSLNNQLRDTNCEPFTSDMRVRIAALNRYYYPDVSVACGDSEFENVEGMRSLVNPRLIVEVLSDSTEKVDRTTKRDAYRILDSLQIYLLVEQEQPYIECYTHQMDGKWVHEAISGLDAVISLSAIGCELKLSEVYRRVTFATPDKAEE